MKIVDLVRIFYMKYCEVHLKPTTCNGYRINIENHIIPQIGDRDADKLTVDDIDELIEDLLAKGLSKRTVRYVLAVLHRAFEFGLKRGYVDRNIISVVDLPIPDRYALFERIVVVLNHDLLEDLLILYTFQSPIFLFLLYQNTLFGVDKIPHTGYNKNATEICSIGSYFPPAMGR